MAGDDPAGYIADRPKTTRSMLVGVCLLCWGASMRLLCGDIVFEIIWPSDSENC